jgi:hypothetical protein
MLTITTTIQFPRIYVSNLYHDSCLVPKTHTENLISCRLEDFIFSKQIHPFVSIFDALVQKLGNVVILMYTEETVLVLNNPTLLKTLW